MCSNLHPKASWERHMWAGCSSPGEVQHFAPSSATTRAPAADWSLILLHQAKSLIKPLKRRIKKQCASFLFLCWWPQLYARVQGRKWRKWVVVLTHINSFSGAPQVGGKRISNVPWEVNKALGVTRISMAGITTSQGISLSFQFRPYVQTSDISTNKICYISVPWLCFQRGWSRIGLCQVAAQSYVCFLSQL